VPHNVTSPGIVQSLSWESQPHTFSPLNVSLPPARVRLGSADRRGLPNHSHPTALAPVQDIDNEDDTNLNTSGDEEDEIQAVDCAGFDVTGDDFDDVAINGVNKLAPKTGFVSALLDSAIPRDLHENTVGFVKGDYVVERKSLLQHATTSDQYDLFAPHRRTVFHRTGGALTASSSLASSSSPPVEAVVVESTQSVESLPHSRSLLTK
jgi:hypothetical protein